MVHQNSSCTIKSCSAQNISSAKVATAETLRYAALHPPRKRTVPGGGMDTELFMCYVFWGPKFLDLKSTFV